MSRQSWCWISALLLSSCGGSDGPEPASCAWHFQTMDGARRIFALAALPSGDVVALGQILDGPPAHSWALRVDDHGDIEWSKASATTGYSSAYLNGSSALMMLRYDQAGAALGRLDDDGNVQDEVALKTPGDYVMSVAGADTGAFVAGYAVAMPRAGWVGRVDVTGGLVWRRELAPDCAADLKTLAGRPAFDPTISSQPQAVTRSGEGAIVAGSCGQMVNEGYTASEVWLARVSGAGEFAWLRTYPKPANAWPQDLAATVGGGAVVLSAGYPQPTSDVGWSRSTLRLLQVNASGDAVGDWTYENGWSALHARLVVLDDGFVIATSVLPDGACAATWRKEGPCDQSPRGRVLRLDAAGQVLWDTPLTLGPTTLVEAVARAADGEFVVGGAWSTQVNNTYGDHAFLVRIDASGVLCRADQ